MEIMGFYKPDKLEEYPLVEQFLQSLRLKSEEEWFDALRWYAKNDLFYLVNFILSERDIIHSELGCKFYYHQHYLDACRQYEQQVVLGGGVDVSGRGSGKSTLRTKCLSIQLILNNPDISIFIFSAEKQLAQKHLRVIKQEFEKNQLLRVLFHDLFWDNMQDAVKAGETIWSASQGICVKRKMIRSTQTVEFHDIFGGGPVGTRADVIMFDDVEHSAMVNSPENIEKLDLAYSQAISLLTPVAISKPLVFITNTRFSMAGLVERQFNKYLSLNPVRARAIPAEDLDIPGNGPQGGTALYPFTAEALWQKYEEAAIKAEYRLQYCLDYRDPEGTTLNEEAINWFDEDPEAIARDKCVYICMDCSRGIDDPTAIWVWGLGPDKKYVWLDGVTRKMDPSKNEFYQEIFAIIAKWNNLANRVVEVRVEQMGSSTWAILIEKELRARGCFTPVRASTSMGNANRGRGAGKHVRIFERWAPIVNRGDFLAPRPLSQKGKGITAYDEKRNPFCLVDYFLRTEYRAFPRGSHDDMLDAGGLINDEKLNEEFPLQRGVMMYKKKPKHYNNRGSSWMSA